MDEHWFPYRYQHVHQRMLHNPVRRERQNVDGALLRLIDQLFMVMAGLERLVQQRLPDALKIFFPVRLKAGNAGQSWLSPPGQRIGQADVLDVRYFLKKIAVSFHRFHLMSGMAFCRAY